MSDEKKPSEVTQTDSSDTQLKRLLADVRWALFQAGNCAGLCGECRERVEEVLVRVQTWEEVGPTFKVAAVAPADNKVCNCYEVGRTNCQSNSGHVDGEAK